MAASSPEHRPMPDHDQWPPFVLPWDDTQPAPPDCATPSMTFLTCHPMTVTISSVRPKLRPCLLKSSVCAMYQTLELAQPSVALKTGTFHRNLLGECGCEVVGQPRKTPRWRR
jgi:hypothetical protein